MVSSVALKYARALVDVSSESNRQEEVQREIAVFASLLEEHTELDETLQNPAIPFSAKRGILERLSPLVPLSKIVTNFLLLLLENGRFHFFPQMQEAYQLILDERRGVVRGTVHAAAELDAAGRERLQRSVSGAVGHDVKLDYRLDPSLIGGLKVQVGSIIFDGSIRAQLEEIRKQLAG